VKGDLGMFLLSAALRTLQIDEKLTVFRGIEFPPWLEEVPFDSFDGSPWLKVDDQRWDHWSSDMVLLLYDKVGGHRVHDPLALDLWIRALGGESDNFWKMHQLSSSRQMMSSLIERGGNPLRALKLR
jgi:hypothetical protein